MNSTQKYIILKNRLAKLVWTQGNEDLVKKISAVLKTHDEYEIDKMINELDTYTRYL